MRQAGVALAMFAAMLVAACGDKTCPAGTRKLGDDECTFPEAAGKGASGSGGATAGRGGRGGSAGRVSGGAGASGASAGASGASAAGIGAMLGDMSTDPCQDKGEGTVCAADMMLHCSAAGTTIRSEVCTSAVFCSLGLAGGACASCNPGMYRCTGEKLDMCNDAGQYALFKTCESAVLCSVNAGDCTTQLCKPNTKVCAPDGTLQTCNAEGTALGSPEPCGANLCDSKHGACYKCVPGSNSCDGEKVIKCGDDGQSMQTTVCTPRTDCTASVCTAGACVETPLAARSQCDSANICDGSGQCIGCIADSDCGEDELCSDKMCVKQTCMPKTAVCTTSGTLQICNDTGSASTTKQCGVGQCNAQGRTCYACPPAVAICRGDTSVVCAADGSGTTETKCVPKGDECSSAMCANGQCAFGVVPAKTACKNNGQCDGNGRCQPCLDGAEMSCTDLPANQCGPGKKTCSNNTWGACIGAPSKPEVCDGMDNNCDGKVDECAPSLTCAKPKNGPASCLPGGSYINTCSNCQVDGAGILTCDCEKFDKTPYHTTLDTKACGGSGIASCSGQLACTGGASDLDACIEQIKAQGTFDVTCKDCTYNYQSLTCSCADRNQPPNYLTTTTMDLPCPGGFQNNTGVLQCLGH